MSASPEQERALARFVQSALQTGGWPDNAVLWTPLDAPRNAGRFCTLRNLAAAPVAGRSEQLPVFLRQTWAITWPAVPTPSAIELQLGAGPILASVVPAAPDVATLLATHELQINAAAAGFTARIDGVALIVSVDAGNEGQDLSLALSATDDAAGASAQLLQDSQGVALRDLLEITVSIQVSANATGDLSPDAEQYLERVRARLFAPVAAAELRAVNLAPLRYGSVQSLDRIQNGSAWQSRAVLDVTLSRSSVTIEQPGLIEKVAAVGTLAPLPPFPVEVGP